MTVQEFIELLRERLESYSEDGFEYPLNTQTFKDAGLLTANEGLVVRTASGDEFHLMVVQWLSGQHDCGGIR